jgi:hypothetical protein
MTMTTTWNDAPLERTLKIEDAIALERRRNQRIKLRIRTEARRMDNSLHAQRNPKLSLTIIDVSEGGLSAISRSPVEAGERLLILFPDDCAPIGGRVFGKVIRCKATAEGWKLAMRFDITPAA